MSHTRVISGTADGGADACETRKALNLVKSRFGCYLPQAAEPVVQTYGTTTPVKQVV